MKKAILSFLSLAASAQMQAQEDKGFLKNSVSVTATPFTAYYWIHPGIKADDEWGGEPTRTQLRAGGTYGLSYHREMSSIFSLHCGLQYAYEEYSYSATLRIDGRQSNLYTINFSQSFLEIPIGLRFYPTHIRQKDDSKKDGLFIQLGVNTDFLLSDHAKQISIIVGDPRFNYSHNNNNSIYTISEERSHKIRYSRSYPVVQVGQVIGTGRYSFFYAGQVQSAAWRQNQNTPHYQFKNFNMGLVLGFTFRF